MAELELYYPPPVIDDQQIVGEYYGLSPQGGYVDLESWWMLQDIKDALPRSGNDFQGVYVQAYQDTLIDFTPLLKLTAAMLDGIEAVNEDEGTVYIQFIHARVIAQLGIPFEIIQAPGYTGSQISNLEQLLEGSYEDAMDGGYAPTSARIAEDIPIFSSNGHVHQKPSCIHSEPEFERKRIDLRSRKRSRNIFS